MTPIEDVVYIAEATADFGRDGGVTIVDADPSAFRLVKPPGMGGKGGGGGVNPEQLFAAGYAACFHGALLFHARRLGTPADGSSVTARVSIGRTADGGFGLAATLVVHLPGLTEDEARVATEAAHAACPYSRAVSGNIPVTLDVLTD